MANITVFLTPILTGLLRFILFYVWPDRILIDNKHNHWYTLDKWYIAMFGALTNALISYVFVVGYFVYHDNPAWTYAALVAVIVSLALCFVVQWCIQNQALISIRDYREFAIGQTDNARYLAKAIRLQHIHCPEFRQWIDQVIVVQTEYIDTTRRLLFSDHP